MEQHHSINLLGQGTQGTVVGILPVEFCTFNPLLPSWEFLQSNMGHTQTVTVVKAKGGHGLENSEGSMRGMGAGKIK